MQKWETMGIAVLADDVKLELARLRRAERTMKKTKI